MIFLKFFQRMSIEQFVGAVVNDDRETNKLMDNWNIEKDEVAKYIINHFRSLGIFYVDPLDYALLIYKHIHLTIMYLPELHEKRQKVAEEIEQQKRKHSRR